MDYDFLLEKRLNELNPALSEHFRSVVFVMNRILDKTVSLFPDFTDHTIRHSTFVMEYANRIIGSEIEKMNADEIYILMCAAFAHDLGMSIDKKTFDSMKDGIVPPDFFKKNPEKTVRDVIRAYHNEFSSALILKHAPMFDFPSDEYAFCIARISKGHRKTDLTDKNEYDPEYTLANGNRVCIPYLAAVLRLCDEMDVSIERNTIASYAEHSDTMSYRQHFAMKKLTINDDRFVLKIQTVEPEIRDACLKTATKLNETLSYCAEVAENETPFRISQKFVDIDLSSGEKRTAVILDTDTGTDDAIAFSLINSMGDFKPDFIIATPGNSSQKQSVKNAVLLKNLFSINATIVAGEAPEDILKMAEKNTFHGNDGLAGISTDIEKKLNLSDENLSDFISMEALKDTLNRYDEIIYIAICPLNSLSSILKEKGLRDKFTRLYIMGGGIREFNCSNNTEFNFSKAPRAVKLILSEDLDITLFPLDLTNHQVLISEDIDELEKAGAMEEATSFLRYNLKANTEYNGIKGAVMHDSMPLLYLIQPEKFRVVEMKLSSDEFGALHESPQGKTVKVALTAENELMKSSIRSVLTAGV